MNKYLYLALTASAIALASTPLDAKESYSQNSSETLFVCATETAIPTLYAYTPGKTTLTPLISWYQEYLLPQQSGKEVCQEVATKLQTLSQEKKPRYIATQPQKEHTVVCMVEVENANCDSDNSQELFGVNSNYDASCVLDRREPLECVAVGKVRGVFTVPDSPYKPMWWPW